MNPLRKHFDSSDPFSFAFVFKDTKTSQSELPDHLHDWHEIVYVHDGKGTIFIDHTLYDMRQDSLFLIPGNTIHRAFPDHDDPITSTALFFNPVLVQTTTPLFDSFRYLHPFEQARTDKDYKKVVSCLERTEIESCLEHIHQELQDRKYGHQHAILLKLQHILLLLNRKLDQAGLRQPEPIAGPSWMKEILLYIDKHACSHHVGLSHLAQKASVTAAHFSRVFKQLTGMNVTDYITMKRIIKSKELMLVSDYTISQIAWDCGFESLPHFHRMFKKIAGMTPNTYRSLGQLKQ